MTFFSFKIFIFVFISFNSYSVHHSLLWYHFFFMLFLFFFFFKTGKFMVGPMSCEQQESRHTDWLFMWSHLCDLMGNNTKCLMLEFHWALCPFSTFSANQLSHSSSFPLALPPQHVPPPIQSPPLLHRHLLPLWSLHMA